jgi:hypothetical protein
VQIQLEVILSTQRAATVNAMKQEMEILIKNTKGNKKKPAICCITDDVEFKYILKSLYSEGFTDLLLCDGTPSTLLEVAPKSVLWENIINLEDFAAEKDSVIVSHLKSNSPSEPSHGQPEHQESEPSSKESMIVPPRDFYYSKSVRISRFSMAAHLNNLIKWREEEIEGAQFVDSPPIEDILRDDDPESQIEVSIDRDKRKQKIIVSGKTDESVKAKVIQVENLLAKLASNRKVLRLHGWKAPHREAMMGSNPLNTISQTYRTTVVFHVTDGHIVAEMMSTTEQGILRMSEYLKALQPVEAKWKFDPQFLIPEPRIRFWNSIRNKYAVMFEKHLIKGVLEVLAWGFGTLLQDSHAELQSAALGRPIPPSTILSAPKADTIIAHAPPESFQIAEYEMQDLEAVYFFKSYEEMFQSYLRQNHHVLVNVGPVSLHNPAHDCLILDIRGCSDDISSAKAYFDRLPHNLNCKQVSVRVVDEQMSREIEDMKVTYHSSHPWWVQKTIGHIYARINPRGHSFIFIE